MKKVFILINVFIMLLITGCKNHDEPTITEDINITEFLIDYDYGKFNPGKLTLLYEGSLMINDLSKYGVDELKAGDVVRISHTGTLKMALSYPGQIIMEEEQIVSVEVIKGKMVELFVRQIPGGGYDILTEDDKYYKLPEYFIYKNEYISINNVYTNLKLYGYIPYNSIEDKVIGLYADNYDKSKIE